MFKHEIKFCNEWASDLKYGQPKGYDEEQHMVDLEAKGEKEIAAAKNEAAWDL